MAAICPECGSHMHLDGPDGLETDFYVCDECGQVALSESYPADDAEIGDDWDPTIYHQDADTDEHEELADEFYANRPRYNWHDDPSWRD